MGQTLLRALLLAVIGALLGLVANAVSPKRIPYITPPPVVAPPSDYIALADAKAQWGGVTFFLDARAPADYVGGHIANAFNLPLEEFDTHYPQVASMLTPDTALIVYCDGEACTLSHDVTTRLRQMGYKNVHILKNGWSVWRDAGLPTTTGANP